MSRLERADRMAGEQKFDVFVFDDISAEERVSCLCLFMLPTTFPNARAVFLMPSFRRQVRKVNFHRLKEMVCPFNVIQDHPNE